MLSGRVAPRQRQCPAGPGLGEGSPALLPQGHQASRIIAWATQRDHKDRDVIAGAQLVIGQPPSSLLQHPSRSHHQLLGHHSVPGGHSTAWLSSDPDPTDSLTQHPAVPGKEGEAGGARGTRKCSLGKRSELRYVHPGEQQTLWSNSLRPKGCVAMTLLQGARPREVLGCRTCLPPPHLQLTCMGHWARSSSAPPSPRQPPPHHS